MAELNRVRTGPTSYLKLNDADLKAWKAAGNTEYGAADAPAEDAEQEQPAEGKVVSGPAENKARTTAPEKKSG